MKIEPLFRNYELLIDKAESAFHRMEEENGSSITCSLQCSDCCHAVFGLFFIEAAYIQRHFENLPNPIKQDTLLRCEKSDQDLDRLQKMLKSFENDPEMSHYTLAKERIRCPLLDEEEKCVLYHARPITCRVYGIPTRIQGKVRVCGKSGFKAGKTYPIFDLDGVYRDLYVLSNELLIQAGDDHTEKASLLITVSKALRTPLGALIKEDFERPVESGTHVPPNSP